MLEGLRRRVVTLRRRPLERASDAGFTLIEVLVAIALIGIVMSAMTSFLVTTMSVTSQQSGQQAAVQVADNAMELVRALKGSAVAAGRDAASVDAQWASPVAGVAPYLSTMARASDGTASFPSGASAPLPTTARSMTINDVSYDQNWYVGTCWQPQGGGDCDITAADRYADFFRVVVAVTWSEQHCPSSLCSYVTVSLVSTGSGEPVFNSNETAVAPTVNNPGAQTGQVSLAVSLQLTASGGAAPLTWTAPGLPPGLSVSAGGLISGTPAAPPGTHSVVATVTDGFGLVGTAAFTWTINPAPLLTSPGSQTTQAGIAVSLSMSVNGGTSPMAWSVTAPGPWGATGLPPGLSINPSTGAITGTPTTIGPANNVTVNVTDAVGGSSSATFAWTVPPLQVQTPAAQTGEVGAAFALQIVATGGVAPYASWTATGLPATLTIGSTGRITGTPTATGIYNSVRVTVRDAAGTTVLTANFRLTVIAGPSITLPTTATRNNTVNTAFSLLATKSGGVAPYTWGATNLPDGISINTSTGLISGTFTAGTRYVTRVTLTDGAGVIASRIFVWNLTATALPLPAGLRITTPNANRTNVLGVAMTAVNSVATGGTLPRTWSASAAYPLPPGITINAAGRISGTATLRGAFTVRVTVQDATGKVAHMMFVWTIT